MLMTVFVAGLLIGVVAATGMLLLFSDDRPLLRSEHAEDRLTGQYDADEAMDTSRSMRLAHHDMQSARERTSRPKQIYFLDAGSYKSLKEADAVKAKLALLGMESSVEPRQVEHEQWYRLKVGPYFSNVDVNVDKAELAMNGIRSELLQTPALPRGTFN